MLLVEVVSERAIHRYGSGVNASSYPTIDIWIMCTYSSVITDKRYLLPHANTIPYMTCTVRGFGAVGGGCF